MFQVSVKSHFDAAHYIKGYDGKCAYIHGHRWYVEVCCGGTQLDELGMLTDFGVIKQALHNILAEFDHGILNNLAYFNTEEKNPTSENLAYFIFNKLKQTELFHDNIKLMWVKVFESPDTYALYME